MNEGIAIYYASLHLFIYESKFDSLLERLLMHGKATQAKSLCLKFMRISFHVNFTWYFHVKFIQKQHFMWNSHNFHIKILPVKLDKIWPNLQAHCGLLVQPESWHVMFGEPWSENPGKQVKVTYEPKTTPLESEM